MLESSPKKPAAAFLVESSMADRAVPGVLESAFPDRDAVSEPGVAHRVSRGAASDSVVFVGNSMPIRDMDLFGHARPDGPQVAANRGASGIDGNIATAAGIARATERPVTAVIGDLAALHDLNSLALVRELKVPFVLVVQNNDGGGIFSLLPIAKHREHFEQFFGTPHGLGFEHAAAMYGLPYCQPATHGEFATMFAAALARNGATFIEVRTDRERNVAIHRELDEKIRAALDKLRR
jgi:2-succinyl-5-enolpyruvyl-6-hydroxy-3-cyclohexene-1-carboxylate synthase